MAGGGSGACSTAWRWRPVARNYDHVIEKTARRFFVDPTRHDVISISATTGLRRQRASAAGFNIENWNAVKVPWLWDVVQDERQRGYTESAGGGWLRRLEFRPN